MTQKPKQRLAYTTIEACEMLAVSRTTLYKVAKQQGIQPLKLGTATRWRNADVRRLAGLASPTTTA